MSHDANTRENLAAAADWLVRLDTGSADPAAFEAWRDSDPRHAAAFAQIAATWKQAGDLRYALVDGEDSVFAEAREPVPTRSGLNRRAAISGLAAGVVAVVAGAGFWMNMRREAAATAIGERRILRLPGGALAHLNTDSALAWRMGEELEIWVEKGEAAIQLAAEGAARAVLYAATIRAELTRGSYNLRLFEHGPRLSVIAGRAKVSGDGGMSGTLTSGEVLASTAAGFTRLSLGTAELAQTGAWQRGEIIFDGMELTAALDEFNRYLAEPIRLDDQSIGAIRLGGRFRTDDPSGFLESLEVGFGISSRRADGGILLYRR